MVYVALKAEFYFFRAFVMIQMEYASAIFSSLKGTIVTA